MCNRYRLTAKEAALAASFRLAHPFGKDLILPTPELFPKRPALVVREISGERRLDTMSWGFPHTITGKTGKPVSKSVTNVRNYASPFWRSALTNPARRCLVPFTAFSEYGSGDPGRVPLHWFTIPSRPVACFAGVWRSLGEVADDSTSQARAFAFLTCEPNPLVGAVHPKAMPVILHEEAQDHWLTAPIAEAITLAVPYPSQLMLMDDLPAADENVLL